MKHIFIINPISGRGKAKSLVSKIESVCKIDNIEYEIHFTKCPMDATKIAKSYKNENNIIFSVGGDGTLNEVVNGIIGSNNMLGIIPAGSGNDFYKTLMHEKDLIIASDIGKINNRYFINIVSFGIDAEIANNVSLMKKRKVPKSQIYNASIIYTLLKYKFKTIEFILNKTNRKEEYTIVAICNGKYYGNGFKMGPNASLNDGVFDIYFAEKISKFSIPNLVLKLKKGLHINSPHIQFNRSKALKIKSNEPIVVNIDGEVMFDNVFDIRLLPKKIKIYNNIDFIKKIIE